MSKSIRQRVSDAVSRGISGAASGISKVGQIPSDAVNLVREKSAARRSDKKDSDLKERLAIEKAQKEFESQTGNRMCPHRYQTALRMGSWPVPDKDVKKYNKIRNRKMDEVSQ